MRKYLVPCPFCGRDQELVDLGNESQYGIKAIIQAGELTRAIYVCQYCFAEIVNHHKTDMLARGHWEASKKSQSPEYRSRQISSLYSPVGMFSWTEYMRERRAAEADPQLMPSFVNLYQGMPYKEQGSRPDVRKVISLRGTYKQATVPAGVIYLTAAVDVQRGSERDPDHPARLELQVLGHGRGYKIWSIDYHVFRGDVLDPFSGAWEAMTQWAIAGGLAYRRADGALFGASMILIDSSNGNDKQIVYAFCGGRGWKSTYPCKGAKVIIADKEKREVGDVPGSIYKRWRTMQIGDADQLLYEVNTQRLQAAHLFEIEHHSQARRRTAGQRIHRYPDQL